MSKNTDFLFQNLQKPETFRQKPVIFVHFWKSRRPYRKSPNIRGPKTQNPRIPGSQNPEFQDISQKTTKNPVFGHFQHLKKRKNRHFPDTNLVVLFSKLSKLTFFDPSKIDTLDPFFDPFFNSGQNHQKWINLSPPLVVIRQNHEKPSKRVKKGVQNWTPYLKIGG